MSSHKVRGRRRATPVRTNPLEIISKAVASNAGSVGRQAAVVAAASGLVLTLGVPAQANQSVGEAAAPADSLTAERVAVQAVAVPATAAKKFEIDRVALKSTPAPKPVVAAVAATVSTSTSTSTSADDARGAAMTSATRAGQATTAAKPAAVKEKAATPTLTASTALGSRIASMALGFKGTPYVWGGSSPSGWDCSGFVQYIYGKAGISLPHNTTAIRTSGKFVQTSTPKLGDLVYQNGGGHVGIYIGDGKIIGAQNPSVGTVIREADSPYGPLMAYYTLKK
ncbi:C40 family peptidase [Zafaria sp. Z1313]|uniref:C40 family peptidase n=1 Tax=unclassified Zafaria TaxID=2828765 RepID=UPI002E791806|nr:C40 family peptidase [Zafaria sp. J156]MEE1622882.1 C40 family peptidase [Zafaria sp. J156]